MAQLVACPECQKHLQVPDALMGKTVQCPECNHAFIARGPDPETILTGTTSSRPPPPPEWEKKPSSNLPVRRRRDADADDADDDDDLPRRSRRRPSSRRGGNYAPHRGGMILAFGLIALIGGMIAYVPVVFGIIAWIMGNADLEEMRQGRMDPEGEGMTQAGRIMGMIATIIAIIVLSLSLLFGCGIFGCWLMAVIGLMGAAAGGAGGPPQPPRKGF